MHQVMFGGVTFTPVHATDTKYNFLMSGIAWHDTYIRHNLISTDGSILYLRVKLDGAPGAGKKYTFTLMLDGNPTALTLDIENAETSGFDIEHRITVAGGEYISLECDPTNTPTARNATWSCIFEGDVEKESLICGQSTDTLSPSSVEYAAIGSVHTVLAGTETNCYQIVPTKGTLKNLYVKLGADPGTAPDAYTFTVRKGTPPGALGDTSLEVTIVADETTGSDLVNTVNVVAGDILTMKITPVSSPAVNPLGVSWGLTFVADVDGESIVLSGSKMSLDDTDTEYNMISPQNAVAWSVTEATHNVLGQICILKKLHMYLSIAPGAGKKFDFTIRIDGADSNVVATVDEGNRAGNSGILTDDVGIDKYVNIKVVPTGTPDTSIAAWGLVCYLGPLIPTEGGNTAATRMAMMIKAGII